MYECRNLPCKIAMGIGYSEVLDLDACNAFGDGVNMAFKLGEDTAEAGEILFTNNILPQLPKSFKFKLEPRQVSMSGITIDYQSVVWDAELAAPLVHRAPFQLQMGWSSWPCYANLFPASALPNRQNSRRPKQLP